MGNEWTGQQPPEVAPRAAEPYAAFRPFYERIGTRIVQSGLQAGEPAPWPPKDATAARAMGW